MSLSNNVKNELRKNSLEVVKKFLEESQEFRLVMWNNDDWDSDLPQDIMRDYPKQILLDITEEVQDNCYVNEDRVLLYLMFGDIEYSKELFPEDIVAILDLEGQPYIVNNFDYEKARNTSISDSITKDDMIESLVDLSEISIDHAKKSVNAMLKNNPQYDIKG